MKREDDPGLWRNLRLGSGIILSDEQTLEDNMKAEKGPNPSDFIIDKITRFEGAAGECEIIEFGLKNDQIPMTLCTKIAGREVEARVYFEPSNFSQGNRQDMLNNGNDWLFVAPPDPNNFSLIDLQYTAEITYMIKLDGESEEWTFIYEMKEQGVLNGTCKFLPEDEERDGVFASYVEYFCKDPICPNPHMMIQETGGEDSLEGGLIVMKFGAVVTTADITVMPA